MIMCTGCISDSVRIINSDRNLMLIVFQRTPGQTRMFNIVYDYNENDDVCEWVECPVSL